MPRTFFRALALALFASAGLAAAPVEPPKDAEPTTKERVLPAEPKTSDVKTLVRDNTRFAFDIYRSLASSEGNVLCSPRSISTSIAMAFAGARWKTADEIKSVMHWSLKEDALHDSFAALTRRLAPPEGSKWSPTYEWTEANRVWLDIEPDTAFYVRLKLSYAAEAGLLDPDKARAAEMINAWTSEQTRGRIKQIVSEADLAHARLVLTNAVYFKGSWYEPFEAGMTASRDFKLSATKTVQVPTLADVRTMPYAKSEECAAVKLGYHGGVSFIVILPDESIQADFEKKLTAEAFAEIDKAFKSTRVDLRLPKFKYQTRQSLNTNLAALGMPMAFTVRAQFTGIAMEAFRLGDVIHIADIDLDENGTEAAAATAIPIAPGAALGQRPEPPKPVIFHADRPFTFVMRHDATGEILFIGRVSDPR